MSKILINFVFHLSGPDSFTSSLPCETKHEQLEISYNCQKQKMETEIAEISS